MALHEDGAKRLLHVALLSANDEEPTAADSAVAPADFKLELRSLLRLSAPVMVQLSAQYGVTVVNQYYIGHQGAGPLAAAAIGNTVSFCAQSCQPEIAVLQVTRGHKLG